jgi:hypothetical protein
MSCFVLILARVYPSINRNQTLLSNSAFANLLGISHQLVTSTNIHPIRLHNIYCSFDI